MSRSTFWVLGVALTLAAACKSPTGPDPDPPKKDPLITLFSSSNNVVVVNTTASFRFEAKYVDACSVSGLNLTANTNQEINVNLDLLVAVLGDNLFSVFCSGNNKQVSEERIVRGVPRVIASLISSADSVFVGEGVTLAGSCGGSVSATRSWALGSAPLAVSEVVVFSTPGLKTPSYTCTGEGGTATATVNVTVFPLLQVSGRFGTYNSGLGKLSGERVYATGSFGTESADVGYDGSWSMSIRARVYTSFRLSADAKNPANRVFREWEIEVSVERWAENRPFLYTRVPIEWAFEVGWYAGTSRTLSLHWDAFNPQVSLLWIAKTPQCTGMTLQTWPNRPIPFALDPASPVIPEQVVMDSALRLIDRAEEELGMNMLVLAPFSMLNYSVSNEGVESWKGIIVRVGKEGSTNNPSNATSSGTGRDIYNGLVYFTDIWAMRKAAVPHELTHTLGLNHAAWPSLQAPGIPDEPEFQIFGSRTTSIAQLLYVDADVVRALGPTAQSGIPGSYQGERRALGLSVETQCQP